MFTTVLVLLLGIVTILAIIAANGYFVAQEFAYMSVDRNKMAAQADAGDAAAARVLKVTERTSFMLSGAQLGITVTGLLVGYVAEPMIGASLGELLGVAGVPTAVSVSVGTVLALAVATIVQMIFGELYPKNLAIAAPDPLARALARSTTIYLALFGWLIVVFDRASNGLLRLVKVEPAEDLDSSATAEDLERIVADSRASGELPEQLSMLIDRILDFPDRNVEHAMIPLTQTRTVAPGRTVAEVRELMAREHSRYPVVSAEFEPLGVIQLADLLRTRAEPNTPVSELMRPPVVLPTLMPLPDALSTLTEARTQLAAVVDEYGGFAGILTVEDMAEELVGELTDEHDDDFDNVIVADDEDAGIWRIDGHVHIDEIERALGHQLPHGDFQTIAGLVIATHRELPDAGQVVRVELPVEPREVVTDDPRRHALDIEVLEVANRVPAKVLVHVVELDDDDNPASTADNNGADHNHDDDDNADRDAPADRSSDAHGMSDLPGEPDARDESGDEAGR